MAMKMMQVGVLLAALLLGCVQSVLANEAGETLPWVKPTDGQQVVWILSGLCVVLCLCMTAYQLMGHHFTWNVPPVQRYQVKILLVPAVYGICGLLTLVFPNLMVILILIRNSFQAYMVLNYVEMLMAYFTPSGTEGMRIRNLGSILARVPKQRAKPPCCCCGILHPSVRFLRDKVLFPIKVFAVAVPALAIIGVLTDQYNAYGFGAQNPDRAWFWLNILTVLSTFWALSGLFTVYQIIEEYLTNIKLQNACIHIVLGPMVFQELIIGILAESGAIGSHFGLNEFGSAVTILNFMFCIESFVVGALFCKAYSYSAFTDLAHDHSFHTGDEEGFVELSEVPKARRGSVVDAPRNSMLTTPIASLLHHVDTKAEREAKANALREDMDEEQGGGGGGAGQAAADAATDEEAAPAPVAAAAAAGAAGDGNEEHDDGAEPEAVTVEVAGDDTTA